MLGREPRVLDDLAEKALRRLGVAVLLMKLRAPDACLRILAGKRMKRFGFVGSDLVHGCRPDCRVRVLPSGLRPELFKDAHAH